MTARSRWSPGDQGQGRQGVCHWGSRDHQGQDACSRPALRAGAFWSTAPCLYRVHLVPISLLQHLADLLYFILKPQHINFLGTSMHLINLVLSGLNPFYFCQVQLPTDKKCIAPANSLYQKHPYYSVLSGCRKAEHQKSPSL